RAARGALVGGILGLVGLGLSRLRGRTSGAGRLGLGLVTGLSSLLARLGRLLLDVLGLLLDGFADLAGGLGRAILGGGGRMADLVGRGLAGGRSGRRRVVPVLLGPRIVEGLAAAPPQIPGPGSHGADHDPSESLGHAAALLRRLRERLLGGSARLAGLLADPVTAGRGLGGVVHRLLDPWQVVLGEPLVGVVDGRPDAFGRFLDLGGGHGDSALPRLVDPRAGPVRGGLDPRGGPVAAPLGELGGLFAVVLGLLGGSTRLLLRDRAEFGRLLAHLLRLDLLALARHVLSLLVSKDSPAATGGGTASATG